MKIPRMSRSKFEIVTVHRYLTISAECWFSNQGSHCLFALEGLLLRKPQRTNDRRFVLSDCRSGSWLSNETSPVTRREERSSFRVSLISSVNFPLILCSSRSRKVIHADLRIVSFDIYPFVFSVLSTRRLWFWSRLCDKHDQSRFVKIGIIDTISTSLRAFGHLMENFKI